MIRSLTFGLLLMGLLAYGFLNGLTMAQVINVQSLVIVLGGIAVVLWLGFPADRIQATAGAVLEGMQAKRTPEENAAAFLPEVLEFAGIYRLKGPLALEKAVKHAKNDYLKFGATLIAEGYDRWSLISALKRESDMTMGERKAQIHLLTTMTRLAPALGMAGTVISLMHVMQGLDTAEQLGPSMGLALSSTLYGILLANLLFLPLASKLEELARRETYEQSLITEALLGIHQAMHPLRIAEKLNAYDLYCRMKKADNESNSMDKTLFHAEPAETARQCSM